MSLWFDWINLEPEETKSILKMQNDDLHTGIVKEFGLGYFAEDGSFVEINQELKVGDRILFTQHLTYEVDGKKLYRTRGRDVIEVLSAKA